MADENKEPLDDENIEGVDIPEELPSDEELYGNDTPLVIPEDECVYGGPVTGNEYDYIIDPNVIGPDGEILIPVDIDSDVYGPIPEVIETEIIDQIIDPVTGMPIDEIFIDDIETETSETAAPQLDGPINTMGWRLGEKGPIDFSSSTFTTEFSGSDEEIDDSWCPDDVPEA